jgi:hypothetical protein
MTVRTIKYNPSVPGCKVSGQLYASDNKKLLGEDMLDVVLPNGFLITAGWYPEGDPLGKYRLSVYRGCEQVTLALESDDVDTIVIDLDEWVRRFNDRNLTAFSDSGSSFSKQINQ